MKQITKNATIYFLLPMTYLSSLNCCLSFQDTRVQLRISNVTMAFALIKDCGVMAISTALTNPTKITANVSQSTSCAHLESASHQGSSVMEEKIAVMILTKTTAVRRFGSSCTALVWLACEVQSIWTSSSQIVLRSRILSYDIFSWLPLAESMRNCVYRAASRCINKVCGTTTCRAFKITFSGSFHEKDTSSPPKLPRR